MVTSLRLLQARKTSTLLAFAMFLRKGITYDEHHYSSPVTTTRLTVSYASKLGENNFLRKKVCLNEPHNNLNTLVFGAIND